ncbi:MAG: sulfur carrier protein ThiS [Moraxellaceae bacterium]|nr:MAG: sulfur carrier protein ThiS [Moraxellaceae bacterium]
MEVTVNHQNYRLNAGCSVAEMLTEVLQNEPKNIAVAVNQRIINKTNWSTHQLMPSDQIVLIKATQGG